MTVPKELLVARVPTPADLAEVVKAMRGRRARTGQSLGIGLWAAMQGAAPSLGD